MGKYVIFIVVGVILLVLGITNYRGNISTIHWYNRIKVSEADVPKYGKCMGIGTIIFGGTLLATALLKILFKNSIVEIAIFVGFAVGLVFLLCGQFKYNKGLF